jgi:predicted regulator of Ras-like GTPase activity (Roadblock/LC7/MglB family)
MTQAYSNPLQIIIDEFKNISPEIKRTFVFKTNGEIVACDETTTDDQSKKLATTFLNLSSKAEVIGGIETLTIQGADSQLNITSTNNNYYLTTVSSRSVDVKIVTSLTRVIIPTVMTLMDEISSDTSDNELPQNVESETKPTEEVILSPQEPISNESATEVQATFSSDPPLPQPPVTQFMVEKIGGLLVPSDTVRVDSGVIKKWSDLYGDIQITQIHIETLEGKTTTCKFRPVKEADINAKGIIQIPEKILQSLQTSKGKLVIVKPVITQS